jgi:hypothetical protein
MFWREFISLRNCRSDSGGCALVVQCLTIAEEFEFAAIFDDAGDAEQGSVVG